VLTRYAGGFLRRSGCVNLKCKPFVWWVSEKEDTMTGIARGYEFWGVCQRQAYQTMNAVHAISTVLKKA